MLTEVYFGFQSQFNLQFSVHYNRGLLELVGPTYNQQFILVNIIVLYVRLIISRPSF